MNTLVTEWPPVARSRTALGLLRGAATGLFVLQSCASCGQAQYPPRDACQRCLGSDLPWQEVDNRGTLKALTTIRLSNEPYFQGRLPWRIGLVASPLGLTLVAHLLPSCRPDEAVILSLRIDAAGRAVVVASPERVTYDATDSDDSHPLESDFISDPDGLTVRVTDGSSELGSEVAASLARRGAQVIQGSSEGAVNAAAVIDTTA